MNLFNFKSTINVVLLFMTIYNGINILKKVNKNFQNCSYLLFFKYKFSN